MRDSPSWSQGLEENQRIVQECEAKFARLVAQQPQGFRAPEVLAKGLDLAVVYLSHGDWMRWMVSWMGWMGLLFALGFRGCEMIPAVFFVVFVLGRGSDAVLELQFDVDPKVATFDLRGYFTFCKNGRTMFSATTTHPLTSCSRAYEPPERACATCGELRSWK